MKIGVVGTFIRDKIHPWQQPAMQSIGGIFFTVSYLANLLDSNGEVYPVAFVGEDFYDELADGLSQYDNVKLDGLHRIKRDNTQVKLVYTAPQERDEITTDPMPSLAFEQLDILKNSQAVLINLITGVDVSLSGLRQFSKSSEALIYLDFHSRALGIDENRKRYYRRPDDWRQWIELTDIVQLNEMEACTLAGIERNDTENLIKFGFEIIEMNPAVCHITLADRGSLLFFQKNGQPQMERQPGQKIDEVIDIIGCGDAFSAAFLTKYLQGVSVSEATAFANQIAAWNCTFVGSTKIDNITAVVED